MKLIRGFLAYFMWTQWMEDVGGDVGDSDGRTCGWSPQDLEAALRASGRLGRIVGLSIFKFAAGFDEFFCTKPSRKKVTSP